MKRVLLLPLLVVLCNSFLSARIGEVRVKFFSGEESEGVIGILRNEDNDKSVVTVHKGLKSGDFTFDIREGKYMLICLRYSFNNSLQIHPIDVNSSSVTEVACKGIPDSDLIEVKGTVIDKETGLPIAGAKVGDYPFILPSEILPHYSHPVKKRKEKKPKYDLGDVARFLKSYNLDKYVYYLTDIKGRFKTFAYTKAVSAFRAINFTVFADGYAPFFYGKRVRDLSEIEGSVDVGTIELVPASSFKLTFVPSLREKEPIYLEPVNTEIEGFPERYLVLSPYRNFGTSSWAPVFVKDNFMWSFIYPWIYAVKWRVKKSDKPHRVADLTSSLAMYELKEKDSKEISLDINECEYGIRVVGVDNEGTDMDKGDFDISIGWRGRYLVANSRSFQELKKGIKVKDIARGRSFITTSVRYGDAEEIFIKEAGIRYKKRPSTTYFYSRVEMEDCPNDSKITVKLEDGELSFVIRDEEGESVEDAKVFAYLYKQGYEPSFECETRSSGEGRAVCKYLRRGEYLVFVHHPQKGYFGPERFATSTNSYQITLKRGKDIEVELLSPEYKSVGEGVFIIATLADTPISLDSTLMLEGEEEKPYRILGPPSDKEERYVAKFSNLPYHDIYLFPETQIGMLGKGWSREAMFLDAEKSGSVQLVLGTGSGAAVFEGKNTGIGFDDSYLVSICKKGEKCLPPLFYAPQIISSPTGGFVIPGLSAGEYKVKLIPIDLGENRKSLESPFFKIYPDQHTIVKEGSFRK